MNVEQSNAAKESLEEFLKAMGQPALNENSSTWFIEKKDGKVFLKERTFNGSTIAWMSDSDWEKQFYSDFVSKAKGRVLVFGLGLGLVAKDLLAKPEVTEVLVIEKEPQVVYLFMRELLEQVLPQREDVVLNVDIGDAFEVDLSEEGKFDFVWADIWPFTSSALHEEAKLLKEKHEVVLSEGGVFDYWTGERNGI